MRLSSRQPISQKAVVPLKKVVLAGAFPDEMPGVLRIDADQASPWPSAARNVPVWVVSKPPWR